MHHMSIACPQPEHRSLRHIVAPTLILVSLGCGTAPPAARIAGQVSYTGTLRGTLVLSAYASFPPRGDPVATVAIAEPRFPQPYELDVPSGSVFLVAMLDTFPDDGFRYHSRVDAGGAWPTLLGPASIRVTPDAEVRADINLVDPSVGLPSP